MAAAIDSAKAEHSPLASASADPTSRQRSPSPCAATWSLPFRHSSPASPSAVLLVLPDGSARLYTEELTVAQLACDFPDLIVSCTVIVAGEMCEGRACDGCDSRAQDKELKPQGAILPPQTVLRLGGTYYLSNRDGLSFGAAASETVGDWRSSSRGSSSSYNSSCNIEDIRSREIYCTSGASISSSVEGSSVAGGSWRTFSSNDDIMCNGSDVGSSYSGNLSAVVSAANESKRFSSDGVVRSSHIRSLSLVFANPQISSPRQDLPCSGNQQVRRPLTPTISRSNDPSAAPSHVQPAQRPPATSSSVAHRRQFLRTTTPMRDRPVAPRHARSRTEIFGDAPILADSLVGDAPIAGWPVTTSAEWASLEHTLRQNKLQLQRSQLQQSQLQPSQQHQRAAHRRRNLSATAAVSPAGWLRADPSPYPSASASASASALPRDHMRSLSLARARLAEYAAGGGAAGGGVGVSAVDQPVGACHVAVPAGRALRRCYSHTETGTGGGGWFGGAGKRSRRRGRGGRRRKRGKRVTEKALPGLIISPN
ncbi:hypothetical protein CLOM_g6542 [Closterium sp. NIES-68]|nr:hypothetical protein CLOM_g6542 [Closterium sp. NIES-68]